MSEDKVLERVKNLEANACADEDCDCNSCDVIRELARIALEEHERAEQAKALGLEAAQKAIEFRERAEKAEAREESFLRTIEHAKAENSRLREALADIAALRDSFMQRR